MKTENISKSDLYTPVHENLYRAIENFLSGYGYDRETIEGLKQYRDFCFKEIDNMCVEYSECWYVAEGNVLFGLRFKPYHHGPSSYGMEIEEVSYKWAVNQAVEEAKRQKNMCEKYYTADDLEGLHKRQKWVEAVHDLNDGVIQGLKD